jgi:putative PIN family toxin of toxin-antitoxin system
MKVVADTMFWVSYCTLKDGYRHRLLNRARRQRVRIYVSKYILDELVSTLVEDLGRSRRYAYLARAAVLRMTKPVVLPSITRRYVPGDSDDDPIVQTALVAKADYLVTADRLILEVGKVHDVEIITGARFERLLDQQQRR